MPSTEKIKNIPVDKELTSLITELQECDKKYQEGLNLTKEIEEYKKYKASESNVIQQVSSSDLEENSSFVPKPLRDVSSYFKMTLEATTLEDLDNLYNHNVNGEKIIDLVLLSFIQELNQVQSFYYSIVDDEDLKTETYEYLCHVKKSRDMLIQFKQDRGENRYVRATK